MHLELFRVSKLEVVDCLKKKWVGEGLNKGDVSNTWLLHMLISVQLETDWLYGLFYSIACTIS